MLAAQQPNGHAQPQTHTEELPFRPSPGATLGVELELQIIDRHTGELVPGAQRILDVCAQEGLEGVDGEYLLSMLEVKTGVCRDVSEVREQICPLLRSARNIANTLGYDLAVGGTHPFSRPSASAISPQERYQKIRKRQGWLAYHEAIFGMHVHVGVPGPEETVGVINLLTPYLPHLLALSANSPFWQGVDTEHASARAVMFHPAAHAGVPPYFAGWGDLCEYFAAMKAGEAVSSVKDLYWDVRPRPDFGTVEVRIFDAPCSPACLLGLAALARCLVVDALRRLGSGATPGSPPEHWLAAENKTLAARYGLQAEAVLWPGRPRATLAADLADLLERLLPLAEELGEARFLREFIAVENYETGAARQRRLYRQTANWQAVLADSRGRWERGLERENAAATGSPVV